MNKETFKGSCLCGEVVYEIEGPFKIFQYCHCSRCRKSTGSAHGSNLFVPPEQFRWLAGEEFITRYEYPDAKYFASTFCSQCGSTLPWAVQGGKNIVVTAGTLDGEPGIRPMWNIFWDSHAAWYKNVSDLPKHIEYPK